MIHEFINIGVKFTTFYENCGAFPNFEEKGYEFLFNEITNDFSEKGIKNTGDWLKYFSTNGNNFEEILKLTESYRDKVLQNKFDNINFEEKLVAFSSIVLYSMEMDVNIPFENLKLRGKIISNFIEIILHYNFVLIGYLSLKGDIFVSDTSKFTFYNIWSADGFSKEIPITL